MLTNSLLILAVIVLGVLIARKAKSASNQAGGKISPPQDWDENKSALKVATFNIQTGKNLSGKRDITASAGLLTDNDIAGVQEVYAAGWLNKLGLGLSQTQALTKQGGFIGLFCATRYRWFREHRGNAILSKLPIESWSVEMLPDKSGKSFRNMTTVEFIWQGEKCYLINTHLHTSVGREQQLACVLEKFSQYDNVILLGDFNSPRDTPLLTRALIEPEVIDAITEAGLALNDGSRIDWILCKGFNIVKGKEVGKGISDHPYYQVQLTPKKLAQTY